MSQHDSEHPACPAEISGIVRAQSTVDVIRINLPEQLVPVELKRTEVTLIMRVVGFVENIELGTPLDQRFSGDMQLVQQVNHTSGYKPLPWNADVAPAGRIVQLGYLGGFG